MTPRMTGIAACVLLLSAGSGAANTRTIVAVHPGCVLELEGGWRTHLTGVVVPGVDTEIGRQALDFCIDRVHGQLVKMFTLTTDDRASGIVRGDDGLPFAEILYGDGLDRDLAAELLRRGLARIDETRLPAHLGHYRDVERQARNRGLGVWASRRLVPPNP